jgi:ABC-type amino acid transport substrate-binding protein
VRVGTVANSTASEYVRDQRITATDFVDLEAAVRALNSGTVEALVHDAPLLRYLVSRDSASELKVLRGTFRRQDYAIAVPSGHPLREQINRELEALIDTEQWRQLLFDYLGDEH